MRDVTLLRDKVSQMSALPRACQKSTVPNKKCGTHLKLFYWFHLASAFLTASAQNSRLVKFYVYCPVLRPLLAIKNAEARCWTTSSATGDEIRIWQLEIIKILKCFWTVKITITRIKAVI
jgi:hypothetical protein